MRAPRRRAAADEFEAVFARTAARYRGADRFTRHYVAAKLRRDPVHADLLRLAAAEGLGAILDIGCGRGQLALALLVAGRASGAVGLDRPGAALRAAERAGSGLGFRALTQDLSQPLTLPPADTVLIVDVLYQLDRASQARLLDAAVAAARRLVLIRTLDPGRGVRSRLSLALEHLARGLWPTSGAVVNPLAPAAIVAQLDRAGFAVEETPCWRGTPFANVLLVARRR